MLELRVLGALYLKGEDGKTIRSVLAQPKRFALLVYLAITSPGGFSRRDKLLALFWPESDEEHGRAALRKALYFLRRALGEEVLVNRGDEEVGLAEGVVWCDAVAFERALEDGELEKAVSLYAGPPLDGFHLGKADEFQRWLELERARLADRCAAALEKLAERAETTGECRRAVDWWKRLAALDPYNTRVALRLMEALTAAGDRANAVQYAEEHERRLREELDIEPDAELAATIERLRHAPAGTSQAGESAPALVEPLQTLERDLPEVRTGQAGPIPLVRALVTYSLVSVVALAVAHALRLRLGLPDWFFPAVVVLIFAGLPVVVVTAWVAGTPLARGWVSWRNSVALIVLAFALLGAAVVGYMATRVMGIGPWGTLIGKGVLQERDPIVLADFEDHAGDPALARLVTDLVRLELEQSPVVRVATDAYVRGVLQRMVRDPQEPLVIELAREVAIREGLKAVVAGEVYVAGSSYLLSARLVTAQTGDQLHAVRETAVNQDAIMPAVERLSADLRERIGESLRTIRSSVPLNQFRTRSLDALRLLTEAGQAQRRGDHDEALGLLNRAIEIDTLFAAAYRLRSIVLRRTSIGQAQAIADATRAYELSNRLPVREQYLVESHYHSRVTGDTEKRIDALLALLHLDPLNGRAMNSLGLSYRVLGQYARAEEMFRRRLELDSLAGPSWGNLSVTLFDQGKFDEAWETVRLWEAKMPPGHRGVANVSASFAAAQGDYDAAEAHIRSLRDRQGQSRFLRAGGSRDLGRLAQMRGRLAEAESHFHDAMALYEGGESPLGRISAAMELAALRVWFRGDTARALETLATALEKWPLDSIEPNERPYSALAGFYAFAGAPARARELLIEWETAVPPELRLMQELDRRIEWGAIALAEGRAGEALAEFQFVRERSACPICELPLLGRAYERADQPDSALAMYERYLTTRFAPWVFPEGSPSSGRAPYWLPVVYERLGDLYEQRGDTANAVLYYGKLVDLWKDADPELQPRVEAARRAIESLSADHKYLPPDR